MVAVGLEEVETYVLQLQNTIAQYIVTHLILELYLAVKRRPVTWVARRWWNQEVFNLDIMMSEVGEMEVVLEEESEVETEARGGEVEVETDMGY